MSAGLHAVPPGADPAAASLSRWWMGLGAMSVVLGGLVAAVTGPLTLPKGSWLAAYLVLVCGVPQYLMGRVTARPGALHTSWPLIVAWNIGNAAVTAGTLLAAPYLVDAGGVLLFVALIAVLCVLLRRRPPDAAVTIRGIRRWLLIAFLSALIVSIPIGLLLANLRVG